MAESSHVPDRLVGARVVSLVPARALTHDGRLVWPAGERGVVDSATEGEVRVRMDRFGYYVPYRPHEVALVISEGSR